MGKTGKNQRAGRQREQQRGRERHERDRKPDVRGREQRARTSERAASLQCSTGTARHDPRARTSEREDAALLIEGVHGLEEALDAEVPLRRVFVAREGDAALERLFGRVRARGVPVERVDRAQLDGRSERGAHQGVIAEMAPFAYRDVSDVAGPSPDGCPRLVVVADHLTDAGNLGALIRSAEAVGAQGLIIPNRRSARVTAATFKASAGAAAHLPIALASNIARALDDLKDAGFWVVGATEHAESALWAIDLTGSIALVVGNEARGVSEIALTRCDMVARLPMRGQVESLNVAQAATACCYEWLRQNFAGGSGDGSQA